MASSKSGYIASFGRMVGICAILAFFLLFIFCNNCLQNTRYLLTAYTLNFCIGMMLWYGNGIISWGLDQYISWLERPVLRFLVGMFSMLIYTVFSFTVFIAGYESLFSNITFWDALSDYQFEDSIITIFITSIITIFLHGRIFFMKWKQSLEETEQLKREHLASQYETLKNQVNPHFLFNSLNALSVLVYKDPDLADKFIKQLSLVYRHVLDTKDKEVITLHQEIEALKAYLFLLEIRFGDNLNVNMRTNDIDKYTIIPLALQMLVENVVKHNIISKSKPLTVDIIQNGNEILVENTLQPKQDTGHSSGIGLENIKARYEYFIEKPVIVESKEQSFAVTLPLMEMVE